MKKGFYDCPWDFLSFDEEPYESARKNKRSIETTNPFLEAMITIERGRVNEQLLKGYSYYGSTPVDISECLPKPKHMMLNGDYTTIVWEDGTSTVLHLKAGEPYDPEKAILYGVLKKIFNNKNADMDRYMREFFDHAIGCNKNKKKKTEGQITLSFNYGATLYYNDSVSTVDCSSEET